MNDSVKKWQKENPDKVKASKLRYKNLKTGLQQEAMEAIKKAKYKTPMSAIKAHCRKCDKGICRQGKNYTNAPVLCDKKKCVFFPFRNGSPSHIKRGLKSDMTKARRRRGK